MLLSIIANVYLTLSIIISNDWTLKTMMYGMHEQFDRLLYKYKDKTLAIKHFYSCFWNFPASWPKSITGGVYTPVGV